MTKFRTHSIDIGLLRYWIRPCLAKVQAFRDVVPMALLSNQTRPVRPFFRVLKAARTHCFMTCRIKRSPVDGDVTLTRASHAAIANINTIVIISTARLQKFSMREK